MEAVYHHLTLYNGNYGFHTQLCTECFKSNLNCMHTKCRLNMQFKILTNQTAWTFLWTCWTEQMKMVHFHRVIFSYKAIAFNLSKWVSLHSVTIWDSVMRDSQIWMSGKAYCLTTDFGVCTLLKRQWMWMCMVTLENFMVLNLREL